MFLDQPIAVVKQRRIAAEFIDDKAADHGGIVGIDDGFGSDELGDNAAAVDVADQHDGHIGAAREAHIGDIGLAEVNFGGAAGAFDQHQIGAIFQPGKLSSTGVISAGFMAA